MINAKKVLTNGVFCPMPFKGLMYNVNGCVKNCIRSAGEIGNLNENSIHAILAGEKNLQTQENMLNDLPGEDCYTCYDLEQGKNNFDIISDRIFYIRELKKEPLESYKVGNHELKTMDVRWSNICNFACIYCDPQFSSRIAKEQGVKVETPAKDREEEFKNYIFDNVEQLEHVYLAGGEPLLMKQNIELLDLLKKHNPSVNLRINTNLSKTDTNIFDKICDFKNVHWTVSVESMEDEFEYIRYGGTWKDFTQNLEHIQKVGHKISFNMLYLLLNYESLFDTIQYLQKQGFHNNSFIAGALLGPLHLNVRHLPDPVLQRISKRIQVLLDDKPGYLLEESLKNILKYIQQPFEKNVLDSIQRIESMDIRRGLNSRTVFSKLYQDVHEYGN